MALASWPSITDDSGLFTDGTVINKALFDAIKASIENDVEAVTNPSVKAKTIIDEVVAARGSAASLTARISASLSAAGLITSLNPPTSFVSGTGVSHGLVPMCPSGAPDITLTGSVNAVETTLTSWTLRADALNGGASFDFTAGGTFANNANAKVLRLKIDAQSVTLINNSTGVASNVWTLRIKVFRLTSTTAGLIGFVTFGAASGAAPTVNHFYNLAAYAGVNFTIDQTISLTGQATTTNDIVMGFSDALQMNQG